MSDIQAVREMLGVRTGFYYSFLKAYQAAGLPGTPTQREFVNYCRGTLPEKTLKLWKSKPWLKEWEKQERLFQPYRGPLQPEGAERFEEFFRELRSYSFPNK